MVRAEADGTDISASGAAGRASGGLQPPAGDDQPALEGVVRERPRVVGATRRARDDGVGEGRPRVRRPRHRAPRRRTGPTARRRPSGRPRANVVSTSARARRSAAAGPWQEQRDDARAEPPRPASPPASSSSSERSSGSATPAPSLDSPSAPNAPRWPSAARPGEGQRQDPVARPAARVRDEPDATGVVLEARLVQRGGGCGR